MQERDESSSSSQRRNQLPPLAPRHSQSTSSKDRTSSSNTGRTPRLSHRSRAGCWTCRARKVKCDEIHPKCGPCTRLNRDCDWDHRWNFSDATSSTQVKYANVLTSGNSVWDRELYLRHIVGDLFQEAVAGNALCIGSRADKQIAQARSYPSTSPVSQQYDDLPSFAVLTTDDERERKAETQRPGTYGVVVTPSSFADLPEYADSAAKASRMGANAQTYCKTAPRSISLRRSRTDTNVVVLDRFEDVSPTSAGPFSLPPPDRRPSLPNGIQYLSISTSAPPGGGIVSKSPLSQGVRPDEHFISHFRHYVFPRLVQPHLQGTPDNMIAHPIRDAFEIEANRFPPLYHAACAVSALNLSYNGRSTMEEALQHYHQAISPQSAAATHGELCSDGTFLRHFLLFIYDICIPMQNEEGGADMWAIHLNHLRRIATERHERLGREPYGYILWSICELDMYACLLGSGNCEFVQTMLQYNRLPLLEQQIPHAAASLAGPYLGNEMNIFPTVLNLNQGVLIATVKLAQTAQSCRHEAANRTSVSPGQYARWQVRVAQLQSEMSSFWQQAYPEFLGPESPLAGQTLPTRVRYVFEHALLLYDAATIYSRTSMFPGQSRIPIANYQDLIADTERRVVSIIGIATIQLEAGQLDRRHVVFPLLMAGVATTRSDAKVRALDLLKAYESSGIGQNTYCARRLLTAVYDEQRRVANNGGRIEDVDWLAVAKARGLTVVNCGF